VSERWSRQRMHAWDEILAWHAGCGGSRGRAGRASGGRRYGRLSATVDRIGGARPGRRNDRHVVSFHRRWAPCRARQARCRGKSPGRRGQHRGIRRGRRATGRVHAAVHAGRSNCAKSLGEPKSALRRSSSRAGRSARCGVFCGSCSTGFSSQYRH
jgi:hypothetical protein